MEYILLRAVNESVNIPIGDIPPITLHGNDENEVRFMKGEFGGVFPWEVRDTEIDEDDYASGDTERISTPEFDEIVARIRAQKRATQGEKSEEAEMENSK